MTVAAVQPYAEPQGELARWVGIAQAAAGLADRIAATEFVPEAMRGKPDVITAAIMYGDELGVGPMQALAGINVIRGKPSPSSELMRALVFRAGHSMRVLKSDGTTCRVLGKRREDSEPTVIEWTIGMAQSAGLLDSNPTWRRYPRAMLLARATSELCRVMFPDVVKGLGHIVDDDADAGAWDAWAATETATEREPERRTSTVQRRRELAEQGIGVASRRDDDPVHHVAPHQDSMGTRRPVEDTPLPGDTPPDPMSAHERLDEWPAGTDQPPLPLSPPESPTDGETGGPLRGDSESAAPSVSSAPAEPLPPVDDTEGVREDEPVGQRLMATLHMMFEDIGVTRDERNKRLAITSRIVGRNITSSRELTRLDALNVVRVLNDANIGLIRFEVDPSAPYGIAIIVDQREDAEQ